MTQRASVGWTSLNSEFSQETAAACAVS